MRWARGPAASSGAVMCPDNAGMYQFSTDFRGPLLVLLQFQLS